MIRNIRLLGRKLARNERGATIVEFALLLPVLLVVLMGAMDVGFNMYATAVFKGVVQQAARNSTVEGSDTSAIDNVVTAGVADLVPDATLSFKRKSYAQFSDVGRPEDFEDVNGDGVCNDGEPYEDANGNSRHDQDRGADGQGGARDAVLYEVTMTFPRLFPLDAFIDIDRNYTHKVETVLRNQPYNNQTQVPQTGNCI